MLRSQFEFAYVLIFSSIIISSAHENPLISFGEICHDDFSCAKPLICSETNQCACPAAPNYQIDCLLCSPSWMSWDRRQCLRIFSSDTYEISHENAMEICSKYQGHLLQINHVEDIQILTNQIDRWLRDQPVNEFDSFELWIDVLNETDEIPPNYWCDTYDETQSIDGNECTSIRIEVNTSLCFNRISCHSNLSFICQKLSTMNDEQSRFLGFIVDLFKPPKPPQPPATFPPPVIIYQTPAMIQQPAAQKKSSNNNTIIIIVVVVCVVGVILMIFLCCCSCGGALLWKKMTGKSSAAPRREKRLTRTSFESTESA